MMTSRYLTIYTDTRAFLAAAGSMLYARETVNNLILGVSERLASDPAAYQDPFFATVSDDDGEICLAAVMTPPHNLILAGDARAETGFPILIDDLKTHPIPIPGVIAPAEMAEQFTGAWKLLVGGSCEASMRMRVYELRHVKMPDLPQGMFKMAGTAEIPTIAQWMQSFELEALGKIHDLDMPRAEKLVSAGNVFTWVVDDAVVSMSMKNRPIAHSITVSGVYTPPEHRRQGYAGTLVASLSQHLLDEGYQFINLFTDLDNPTSNKIYQTIGYHPVSDFLAYRFNKTSRQPAH
jgi:hypothetical protein